MRFGNAFATGRRSDLTMHENDDEYYDYPCPCDTCQDPCDVWEARYCCDYCIWYNGGIKPDNCDDCDPMNI